jgi:hypothetical protein
VGSPEFMFAILDFHAVEPYQSNELLLWDRPNFCFLMSFTCIGAISEQRVTFVGSLGLMPPGVFYTHWGNLRLTCCFCGIARTHGRYAFSHAPGQHQINELLQWDRPSSCFVLSFTCIGQHQADELLLLDRPNSLMLTPAIYMHWGNIRLMIRFAIGVMRQHATQRYPKLTNCFCSIAQIHASDYVLHALGQYQCLLSCFTRIGAIPE